MPEPGKFFVVSYVPLLTGEPGDAIGASPAGVQSLLQTVDRLPDGGAVAMLWGISPEGDPWPIFVLRKGDDIFNHLVDWSEGSPTSWFDLRMVTRGDDYVIALVPRVGQSVSRFRTAWESKRGSAIPADASFQILFKSVHFSSQPGSSSTWKKVRDVLKPSVKVGFLDADRFADPADIQENLDPALISWIGPFDVQGDKDDCLSPMLPKSKNRLKAERRVRRQPRPKE